MRNRLMVGHYVLNVEILGSNPVSAANVGRGVMATRHLVAMKLRVQFSSITPKKSYLAVRP